MGSPAGDTAFCHGSFTKLFLVSSNYIFPIPNIFRQKFTVTNAQYSNFVRKITRVRSVSENVHSSSITTLSGRLHFFFFFFFFFFAR